MAVLAGILAYIGPTPCQAVVPLTTQPIPQRIALADLVVQGKVIHIEEEAVAASPLMALPQFKQSVNFRVVRIKPDKIFVGEKKELKEIRVGVPQPPSRAGKAVTPKITLGLDQSGIFFLRKHPEEAFFVAQDFSDFLDHAKSKNFARDQALAEKCAGLISDSSAGLRAKEATDRYVTAAMLIFRYRTPRHAYPGTPVTEAVDGKESALILKALTEADWNEKGLPSAMAPISLFLRLDLTEDDHWRTPDDPKDLKEAARNWLRNHGDSYRLKKYGPPSNSSRR